MLTMITATLWIDLERVVRVSSENGECKYTMDFKDKMVTYYLSAQDGAWLLRTLDEIRMDNLQKEEQANLAEKITEDIETEIGENLWPTQ